MPSEPARQSLTARRVEATRLAIAVEALRLAHLRDWQKVSVADIVDAAQVSERSFYRYFQNKGDVFRPLLDEAADRFCAHFENSPHEALPRRTAEALWDSFEEFPDGVHNAWLAYRLLHTTEALTPVWVEGALSAELRLAETLRSSLPDLDAEDDSRLLAAVLLAGQRFGIMKWVHDDDIDTLIEHVEASAARALSFS